MKTRKTLSAIFILTAVAFGAMKPALASIENTNRVNAIAIAKARANVETLDRRFDEVCQDIFAEIPTNSGGADCETVRQDCTTQLSEGFRTRSQEKIDACDPSIVTDECFISQGFNIDHCTDQGFSSEECVDQCSDDSTPASRCLEEIDFRRERAFIVAKFRARLRPVCQLEAQPGDPIVDNPVVEEPAQNTNPNQIEIANGAEPATGGCSLGGVSGGAGSFSMWVLGSLPLVVAWIKRKK
jgi:hypothetical protein